MEGHHRGSWSIPRSSMATILLNTCLNWHWRVLTKPVFALVEVIVAVFGIKAVERLLPPA